MATGTLVDERIESGQRLVKQLALEGLDVAAACWVREADDDRWHLYIASKTVDEGDNRVNAIGQILDAIRSIGSPAISFLDFKLISDTHPIVRDVQHFHRQFPTSKPARWMQPRLGDISIEEAYIYPPVQPEEVWLRQPFQVIYQRQAEADHWRATTKRESLRRGIAARGAVAYSTALRGDESPAETTFAIVSVLLEVPPNLDPANLDQPEFQSLMAAQVRELADELFRAKHPDAIIEHVEDAENND